MEESNWTNAIRIKHVGRLAHRDRLSKEDEAKITELYRDPNITVTAITKRFQISYGTLLKIVRLSNIPMRGRGFSSDAYSSY